MLKKLKLSTQIALLPSVAAIGFATLIALNLLVGRHSVHLERIENGFLPSIETSRELEDILGRVQRSFQDAASTMDEAELAASDELRDRFMESVRSAGSNSARDVAQDRALQERFTKYFDSARSVCLRMIAGVEDASVITDMQAMVKENQAIAAMVEQGSEAARSAIAEAFALARADSEVATRLNVVTALLALCLLLLLAFALQRGAVRVLAETLVDLSAAASEILAIAEQTEANSTDEAAAVDETRRTMANLREAAADIAEASQTVLSTAERSASAGEAIAERISTLNAQALRIADISETIQGIADKSDVLALNAALEGAKAGDAGRGFVLVGSEMRRLTETVLGAVRQIRQLTGEIRELSHSAAMAAEEGQKLASETAVASRRITTISGQQRSGTDQVSQSMDGITDFTRQALAGSKQSTATANDLVRTAGTLGSILQGYGSSAQSPQARTEATSREGG